MKKTLLNKRLLGLFIGLMFGLSYSFGQATYYVDQLNGNDNMNQGTFEQPFATIQHAVDVAPGTGASVIKLVGNFDISTAVNITNKNIQITSAETTESIIYVTNAESNGFYCYGLATNMVVFKNVKISGGDNAIYCNGTKLNVENCYIELSNTGISAYNSSGGVQVMYTIINDVLAGISSDSSKINVVNNTIYSSSGNGTAISVNYFAAASNIMSNIIYYFDYSIYDTYGNSLIAYNDIYSCNYSKPESLNFTNITDDPMLNFDLSLQEGSPCIGKGEGGSDIGAVKYTANCYLKLNESYDLNNYVFNAYTEGYTSSTYNWYIDDSLTGITTDSMQKTFDQIGEYEIKVIVDDATCGVNADSLTVYISYIPCTTTGSFTIASIDSLSGKVVFNISALNTDTVIIYYGDGEGDTIKYTGETTVSHIFEPGMYYSNYAFFYNIGGGCSTESMVSDPVIVYSKECKIIFSDYYLNPLEGTFNFFNDNLMIEPNVAVSVKFSDGLTDTFSLNQINYMHEFMHKFARAGYDKIIITSKGKVCQTTDTAEIYVYGVDCPYLSISKNLVTGNKYKINVSGGTGTSIYNWELTSGSLDTVITTKDSSLTFDFPANEQIDIYANISDTINACFTTLYEFVSTGNMNCRSDFSTEQDSLKLTVYNYSTEEKTYLWDFGDGTTDTSYLPKPHVYKTAGIYTVSLTVYDKLLNCMMSSSRTITIGKVDCSASFTAKVDGQKVSFTNMSVGNQYSYWYFDDYGWSEENNPVHEFEDPGVYNIYLAVFNDKGCVNELYKEIRVGDITSLIVPEFYYFVDNENNSVQFSDASTKNVDNWYWTFGDGSFSTDTNPTHKFKEAGIYEICLTASNTTYGFSESVCYEIWVGNVECTAQAGFTYRVDSKTNSLTLTNQSKGAISIYYWDFGDGYTSNDSAPKAHIYDNPGYYLIGISVQKANSYCYDYYYEYVQVGEIACVADFDFKVDAAKKTATFINKSKGAEFYWWFDDGDYSTDKNPIKEFAYNGLHYAGLTAIDSTGLCWNYIEKEIQVGEIECSAMFTYYVDKSTNTVTCQNKSIGTSTEYYWVFGDGSISTNTNPAHKFETQGYYYIGLNTYDAVSGCMDYFEEIVLVGEEGTDCEADFVYSIDNSKQEVTFKDNSKGTIVEYVWDFGDGEWAADAKTTHKYNEGGYYNVCLNVLNNMGIPNITCKEIKIATTAKTDCQAKFAYSVDIAKNTVTFFNKSLGKPTGFEWNFGDGNTVAKSAKPDTTHKYSKDDYYLTSLVITTDSGCTSSAYELVNLNMPDTGFVVRFGYEANPYDKKAGGYPIDFIGAGLGDQAKLKWNFGDDSKDSVNTTSNTPTHVYDDASNPYTVCLTYADPVTGDSATHCEEVTTAKLCASDQMGPNVVCKAYTLVLDAAGKGTLKTSDVDNKSADDCGAITLALSKTSFTTADLGDKKVTLTATDQSGNKANCEATVTVTASNAINSAVMLSGLEVYPNPFNDKITVSYNLLDNSTVDIAIYDMVGKQVTSLSSNKLMQGLQTAQYDVSGLQSGSYVLQIRASNGVVKKQMIMKK